MAESLAARSRQSSKWQLQIHKQFASRSAEWDVMSDVTKSRLYGFHDVVDSEAMFVRLLGRFREERIVP